VAMIRRGMRATHRIRGHRARSRISQGWGSQKLPKTQKKGACKRGRNKEDIVKPLDRRKSSSRMSLGIGKISSNLRSGGTQGLIGGVLVERKGKKIAGPDFAFRYSHKKRGTSSILNGFGEKGANTL